MERFTLAPVDFLEEPFFTEPPTVPLVLVLRPVPVSVSAFVSEVRCERDTCTWYSEECFPSADFTVTRMIVVLPAALKVWRLTVILLPSSALCAENQISFSSAGTVVSYSRCSGEKSGEREIPSGL